MTTDRRATIAAALDASEANDGQLPSDFVAPEVDTNSEIVDPSKTLVDSDNPIVADDKPIAADDKPIVADDKTSPADKEPKPGDAPKPGEDKPPQSWRAAQKAQWSTLPAEVKSEILRRERDHERVLSESSTSRQIAGAFAQVVQPYMARIQSLGVHPMVAANELFKADHVLYTSPMPQRAAKMAELIDFYSVDLQELENALLARQPNNAARAPAPSADVARIVQEQLEPLRQFVSVQQQQEMARQQQAIQQVTATVEQMAADNIKFPFFEDVRQDMADIIEIQSKKGLYLTPEQAYNRAIAMNPEVSAQVAQLAAKTKQQQAARGASARAQRALAASKSVVGAPGGVGGGEGNTKDRRATIAAAFDAMEGR